ncbi:MAG: uroporphyrinogen decarboxylase family protein [Candidatus Aminicenantes bacterium]|nr:uroporphyrinogen decarboxylase family protein [Candidatus Aminicenantes bacterium]
MGFPGVGLIQSNIKLAQQNFGEHFRVIKKLVDIFAPDIAFPLMDLSVEANAIGRYTIFPTQDSATVPKDRFLFEEIEHFKDINISFDSRVIGYVETVKLMSIGLPEHVIKGAYVTGPYTVAALIMGAQEAAMATITRPEDLHKLCGVMTDKIQEYVRLLISAGAEIICILEPSAVMLGPQQFHQFSTYYVRHINQSCRYSGVSTVYHTCGNTMHHIGNMVNGGVGGISLDSKDVGVDMLRVAEQVPENVVVMGNINPTKTMALGRPADVRKEVSELLELMRPYPNFILSTGCDLPQETPTENIKAFMDTARNYKLSSSN